MNLTNDTLSSLRGCTDTHMQPLYVRVLRQPGVSIYAVDEIARAAGWQVIGFYPPPSRDIGLQAEDAVLEPVGAVSLVSALAAVGIEACVMPYGALGYRISGR